MKFLLPCWVLAFALAGCAAKPKPVDERQTSPQAVAAEEEQDKESQPGPCSQWVPKHEAAIDLTRRKLEEMTCGAALWLDGLFGPDDNIAAARGVTGRLETSLAYSEFYGMRSRTRFYVRTDLPNLRDRYSAFVGRDNEDDFVRDRQEGFGMRSQMPRVNDDDEWLAGLGYAFPGNERFSNDIRAGVRNVRHPRIFVHSRMRYLAYSDDNDLIAMRLTPFWNTRDGFGITPGFDFSHVLTPALLFRWDNVGTLSQETDGFDWRSALILYQGLKKGRGLAYEAFIRGATEAPVPMREYGVQTVYRQPWYQGKLFGEFLVGYTWPREEPDEPRDGSYLVGFGLELPFGKEAEKR